MTNLKEIQGLNQYCGPAVLSAITGKSTDACAAVIGAISGRREIKAVQIPHLLEAVKRLGFEPFEIKTQARMLYGCLALLSGREGFYIVLVPGHVVAVEVKERQIYLIDNHTKHPINAQASARLTQSVDKIWQVKKQPESSQEDLSKRRIKFLEDEINSLARRIDDLQDQMTTRMKELQNLKKENNA